MTATAAKRYTSNSKLVKVRADSLEIHPQAQRALIKSKVNRLEADFDLDAIGVIHAVEYEINGVTRMWVIDGQHRLAALKNHGFGEWLVEVKVHLEVDSHERASELFLLLNDRTVVSPLDKYWNALVANYSDAVGVDQILRDRKLRLGKTTTDGQLACVVTLRKLFQRDGGTALEATLDTLIAAWGAVAAAMEGKLIEGLGMVYGKYNSTVDRPYMARKLAKYDGGASALLGDAKGMQQFRKVPIGKCVAERIIETYNSGKQTNRLELL